MWADPRRWGSLIGMAGGLVFVGSYSGALGQVVSVSAWMLGLGLALAALTRHYIWPVSLGPLTHPRPVAMLIYIACVVGELAVISFGTRMLRTAGHSDLRPALIAAVVGVHFIPFAWAFGERMFFWLGGLVAGLGTIGLVAGFIGVAHAAQATAVLSGVVMLSIISLYAAGHFAPAPSTTS